MAHRLFGSHYVVPTPAARSEARKLLPRLSDYYALRENALKLAFWPNAGESSQHGKVADLDWEWIKGMSAPKGAELRIRDAIGGHNNLRVIFWPAKIILPGDPSMPRIWILSVLQKKTRKFSERDLRSFAARVTVIRRRHYPEGS